MMESQWVEIPPQDLSVIAAQQSPSPTAGDVFQIAYYISPNNIPVAFRRKLDLEKHKFIIEFQYYEKEKYDFRDFGEGVVLAIGKDTKRLYEIQFDIEKVKKPSSITITFISEILDKLPPIDQKKYFRRPGDNYKAIEEILSLDKFHILPKTRRWEELTFA